MDMGSLRCCGAASRGVSSEGLQLWTWAVCVAVGQLRAGLALRGAIYVAAEAALDSST